MFVSRAYVELARDRGESLDARRWLVYPSIAVVLAFATCLLIIGPPLPLLAFVFDGRNETMFDIPHHQAGEIRFVIGVGSVLFGSWWILASAFCAAFLRPIRFVFTPLLDGLRRKHFAVLAAIGTVVAAIGATLIYYRHY
jgi:predicted membrane protein